MHSKGDLEGEGQALCHFASLAKIAAIPCRRVVDS